MRIFLNDSVPYRCILSLAVLAVLLPVNSLQAVLLTFDTVSGVSATVVTNTDGSTYYNEFSGANNAPNPVSGAGQSSIGNGSWQADGLGGKHTIQVYNIGTGTGDGVNEEAFTGAVGASPAIRLRDIESFSWDTNKSTGAGTADWYVQIYTLTDAQGGPDTGFAGFSGINGDDSSGWYGRRLTFENAYAYSPSGPAGVFNTWTTDAGTNRLGFFDDNGPASTTGGFSGGPTLADGGGASVNWDPVSEGGNWPISGLSKGATGSTTNVPYQDEIISVIRISAGTPNNIDSLLDNFNFTLKSSFDSGVDPGLVAGQTVQIDFEDPNFSAPVPEPTALLLLVSGLLGLGVLRRRRRCKA